MAPHLGAGAGRAIEDAYEYILSTLLTHQSCNRQTLTKIAEIYDQICCPRGAELMHMEKSRLCGKTCHMDCPGFENVAEGDTNVPLENLNDVFQQVEEWFKWVGEDSVEGDIGCRR